jgi:mannose-1-phosphate guanylyltransferase
VLARIPEGRRVSVERETFPALVDDGVVYGRASDAYWLDTGTPLSFLRANSDLLNGTRPGPPTPYAVESAPGVWTVGSPSMRGELSPPSLVGAGTEVEAGAVVRASVLETGAVVVHDAVVEGSVVLAGARVGVGARVTGSILGRGSVVGEGCVLEPVTVVGDEVHVEAGTRLRDARVSAQVA